MNIAEIFIYRSTPKGSIFSYLIPAEWGEILQEGFLVEVPFGNYNTKGIVWRIKKNQPVPDFNLKPIVRIIDTNPILFPWQRKLLDWIVEYYASPLLSVVKAVLPDFLFSLKKKVKSLEANFKNNLLFSCVKLTNEQQKCVIEILAEENKIFLLYGITGSGKTEVYLEVIKKTLEQGKQALILVPEISLTPQMIFRFQRFFPNQEIAVWNSLLAKGKKSYWWHKIRRKEVSLVIGSRSAVFVPFANLGIIIIDEEHENAYKQENSPRYDARTVAGKLVELCDSKLVLGSATPRVETFFQAQKGKIKLLELKDRITNSELKQQGKLFFDGQYPLIKLIDLRKEDGAILSKELYLAIDKTLKNKEITFLFLNRRGFSSYLFCKDCGCVFMCQTCSVPLIYHRKKDYAEFICHHCGLVEKPFSICSKCQSHNIQYGGVGTQKVEREVKKLWPKARVYRMDKDSMGKKGSFYVLYDLLTKRKVDILIGTQMITKGWDIPFVTNIGIVQADIGLHLPDFRAGERTFQLLAQVAGRAGRRGEKASVYCQTYNPENTYIQKAALYDYQGFYNYEIELRKIADYPPFAKLIQLIYENKNEENAKKEAQNLALKLKEWIQKNNINMELPCNAPCFLTKIRNKFRWQILLKGEVVLEILKLVPVEWKIDVDPIDLL